MKTHPVTLVKRLLWIAILFPIATFGDQTDGRLDKLFATLKSSEDAVVQHETILTIWKIWYESDREDIEKLMEEGGEALRSGQLERAEQVFTKVIEISPEFSEGWNRRATVRYYRRDYTGSLDDIKRTLTLEPRHFGAIWGRGMILALQRDLTGSIRAFEQLLEINPYSQDAVRRIELLKKEIEKNSV
jgi:tetratricopeptide (TPR) repeat protein